MNKVMNMGLGALRWPGSVGRCEALLLMVAVVWGSSYGVAKGALLWYPVLGFLALRFLLTALLLLPLYRAWTWPQWRAALAAGLPMGGLLWLVFLAETYGVTQTTASQAAFLISLCVVLTPFVEWIFQGKRPSVDVWGAAAVSCAGTWLLVGGQAWVWSWGDALMLLAAVLRAVLMAASPRLTARYTGPSLALTAIQAAVVGLGSRCWPLCSCPGRSWHCRRHQPFGWVWSIWCWAARCLRFLRRTMRRGAHLPAGWPCCWAANRCLAHSLPCSGWARASRLWPGRGLLWC